MVTSLVVFENGELKREPVEVTYRTLTYYFDDNIAKIVDEPKAPVERRKGRTAPAVPEPASFEVSEQRVLQVDASMAAALRSSTELAGDPPPLLKKSKPEGVESAFAARKQTEAATEKFVETRVDTAQTEPKVEPKAEPKIEPKAPPPGSFTENVAALNLKQAYDLYLAGRNRFDSGDSLGSDRLVPAIAQAGARIRGGPFKSRPCISETAEGPRRRQSFQGVESNSIPNVAEAHYGLGFVNFRLGRFRDAADAFKKATSLDAKMAKAHYGLASLIRNSGTTNGLMEEYRILETLDKSLAKKLAQTFPQFNFSCRLLRGCP